MLQQNNSDDRNDSGPTSPAGDASYALNRSGKRIDPPKKKSRIEDPAANLIRQKIDALYDDAPEATEELKEFKREEVSGKPLSKHQKFMYALSTSGKGLAEIQTAWHNYYLGLPDSEKHAVWREFYENSGQGSQYQKYVTRQPEKPKAVEAVKQAAEESKPVQRAVNPNQSIVREYPLPGRSRSREKRTAADIKRQIVGKVSADGKLKAKHHVQSLLFGLAIGSIVVLITLFSFFNEYIIAPFIQPSRQASATPLILGADSVSASSTPEVIIPKINVEIPLVMNIGTTNEDQIENALEDGVIHYPTTVLPGQRGNAAFFGHSSNNIFNPGKYKFAFALLHDIVPGDTFYLTYGGKVYAYQVFEKKVVDPSEVGVLDNVPGKVATATLITCDPPGTSLHRLVVWGEQVSPNPSANVGGNNTSATVTNTSTQLPSNGPTLWQRLTSWL